MRTAPIEDGALIVDKPTGMTSHDVVASVRRALRGSRIGHTGTLDPLATGVLPLLVGRATRLARFLAGAPKEYVATVRFGWATDTYDAEGRPVGDRTEPATVEPSQLDAALRRFRGSFLQRPPAYSAKKVGGVRAYAMARRDEVPRLAAADVHVHDLELLGMDGGDVRLRVGCSAGFYVRSLAHDLGEALGTGAHLVALRRTASGAFGIAGAVPLATVLEHPEAAWQALVPMPEVLADWPSVQLTAAGERRVGHGQPPGPDGVASGTAGDARWVRLIAPDGSLAAIAEADEPAPAALRPAVVLR